MTETVKRGRPTRPEREARDARVLDVAARYFAEFGFHGVSFDAIASEAGVTKRTIYQHFGDKHELLRAVVQHEHAYAMQPVADLQTACEALVAALFSDRAVGLHRAVLAVAGTDARTASAFYTAGPLAAQRYLASLDGVDEGRAELLFGSLLGEPHRRRLLNLDSAPGIEAVRDHVRNVLGCLGHSI